MVQQEQGLGNPNPKLQAVNAAQKRQNQQKVIQETAQAVASGQASLEQIAQQDPQMAQAVVQMLQQG